MYGVIEPKTGEIFFLELPYLNTDNFQIFLHHFSQAFPITFNILVLDNATFHKAKALNLAHNLATASLHS
ncbi:MAG: transposase [Blastocatellia bacterium]|nr:transposase [Blastocatellia bacterium]